MIQELDTIQEEVGEIYDFVTSTIPDDMAVLPEIGSELAVLVARTGKMLADAKYHQNKAIKLSIQNHINDKISPSVLTKLVNAECELENYIVDFCERLNRSCTHQLDWCRTLISKGKEEIRLSNMIQVH